MTQVTTFNFLEHYNYDHDCRVSLVVKTKVGRAL